MLEVRFLLVDAKGAMAADQQPADTTKIGKPTGFVMVRQNRQRKAKAA